MSEEYIENKIKELGLTAPRITPAHIDEKIADVLYYNFPNTTVTVCCLLLSNGFTVLGESACASPENFSYEIGKEIAFKNAREKIWQLEGYLLREILSHQENN